MHCRSVGFELNDSTLEQSQAVRRLLSPTARLLYDLDADVVDPQKMQLELEPAARRIQKLLEASGVLELGHLNLPMGVEDLCRALPHS